MSQSVSDIVTHRAVGGQLKILRRWLCGKKRLKKTDDGLCRDNFCLQTLLNEAVYFAVSLVPHSNEREFGIFKSSVSV